MGQYIEILMTLTTLCIKYLIAFQGVERRNQFSQDIIIAWCFIKAQNVES